MDGFSSTVDTTVARHFAAECRILSADHKIFLDNEQTIMPCGHNSGACAISHGAKVRALGIGHPSAMNLAVQRQELARLADNNIQLVPTSRLIEIEPRRKGLWQASLSR